MRKVGFVSWEVGSGQNTAAVNLGIGLARQGKRVLLANLNHSLRLYEWLCEDTDEKGLHYNHVYSSLYGVDFIYPEAGQDLGINALDYDYAVLNIGGAEDGFCEQGIAACDYIVACTRLRNPDECAELLDLHSKVKAYRKDERGLDLILPMQIHSGEWEINSQRLFQLMEAFGDEAIADFLPHCERIHDLFITRQSVWQIPQPAIIDAFDRMVERINEFSRD